MLKTWKEQRRSKGYRTHFLRLKYTSPSRKKNGLSYNGFINAIKWCIRKKKNFNKQHICRILKKLEKTK